MTAQQLCKQAHTRFTNIEVLYKHSSNFKMTHNGRQADRWELH